MGFLATLLGKKKEHNNAFNRPELNTRTTDRQREVQASILFKDEHEPDWLLSGKIVPDPLPAPSFINDRPPELPVAIRQKVGRALEGRFQMNVDSTKLIALLNNQNAEPGEITYAVTRDPNLTTRILRTVNSAQFGLAQPITAVGRAVVLLGFNNIRALAMAHAVNLKSLSPDESARMRMLWMNSAVTSACASSLAKKLGNGIDMGEAATAGLLMNIGKMLLKPEETGILSSQTGLPPSVVEGFAGSCFAETWGLPTMTGKVLETSNVPFHYPVEVIPAEYRKLSLMVGFAGFVTRWYGFANGDTPEVPHQGFLDAISWKRPRSDHWIEADTALEMEKARRAMEVYLG